MQSKRHSPDRWIFYTFLALIVWVPLPFGSNRPWAWSIVEVWVFLLAIFWLLTCIRGKVTITPVFKKAIPVLLLFCLWLVLIYLQITPLSIEWLTTLSPESVNIHANSQSTSETATISVNQHATQEGLLKSIAYVLIFCLSLLLVRSRRRIKQLAAVIILGGLFQAVYGSLMTLSGLGYGFFIKHPSVLQQVSGTFINRNHMAAYLVMCLSVGIGIMIASLDTEEYDTWKKKVRKWLKLFLSPKLRLRLYLVMMVIALVMTHSRMGNTAFFASLIIAGGMGLILSRHATRSTIILLASLIIIDIFIVGTWFGIEKVAERIEQTTLVKESRDEVDEYAIVQWQDYKWAGSGLGSFYSVFPKYRKSDVPGYYNHAHNDYMELGTETGLIGTALLCLAVTGSLLMALIAQYRRKDPLMRGISFASMMTITAILIHSTVEFNLQIPANAVTFMLLLAMAWLSISLNSSNSISNTT